MKQLLLAAVLLAVPLAGCDVNDRSDDEKALQELNVNAKYLVESVEVSGQKNWHISDSLRAEFNKMVGSKVDYQALDRLAVRQQSRALGSFRFRGAAVFLRARRRSSLDPPQAPVKPTCDNPAHVTPL